MADLSRLYEFLAVRNPDAAARAVQALVDAPVRLLQNPRIGERVVEFEPREVRRVLVGGYELRYEITESRMYVLRIWHTRKKSGQAEPAPTTTPATIGNVIHPSAVGPSRRTAATG